MRIGGRTVFSRVLDAVVEIEDIVLSVRDPDPFREELERIGWASVDLPRGEGRALLREDATLHGDGSILRREGRMLRLLPDPTPDLGPMAGIAGGLARVKGEATAVISADLPFLSGRLVGRLLDELERDGGAEAAVPLSGGREQWLCAAYRSGLAPAAAAYLRSHRDRPGGASVHGFARNLRVRRLGPEELEGIGDTDAMLRGIDTPEDLVWARARAEETPEE